MKNSLDKGSAKKTNKRGQFGNNTKNYAVVHRKEKEDVLNSMISKKVLVSVEKDTEGVKMENINGNINERPKEIEPVDGAKEMLVTQEISNEDIPMENQILITEGEFVNQVEEKDRKSTRLNSSHIQKTSMTSSA